MKKLLQFSLVLLVGGLAACSPASAATLPPTATLLPVIVTQVAATVTPSLAPATDTALPPTATDLPSATPSVAASASALPSDTATLAPSASATPVTWPTPDATATLRRVRLPILMYHYVEPWPVDADAVRKGLTVTPEDFQAQMAYLHDHGYVTVSLYDLIDALALGKELPANAVVLTFDDGYRSLLDYVVPVLDQYGYKGTVFVITQFMDEARAEYLTWEQAEALYAQGWKIEPHTKTHDNLKGRGRDFQLYQILGSVQTVEAHIGTTPRFLAYPSGQYDELTVQLVDEIHLWGAVTTVAGRVHYYRDRFELSRVRVSGDAALQDFIFGLVGDN